MKAKILFPAALLMVALASFAQRQTDQLDRGLVAMKVSNGVFVSWRVLGEEYYDVQYNVYRGTEKLNDEPLNVSNFLDKSGTSSSVYTIKKVVKGIEDSTPSKQVTPWSSSYKEIVLEHEGIKSTLVPNDACCADVDGDGELEIIMKFDNLSEMEQSYPKYGPKIDGVNTYEYTIFECLKLDGTRLWWLNCGPNMADFQNNEQNVVAYDWDGDGKAECVMRVTDGAVMHTSKGTTYTIGNASSNVRAANGGGVNWFITTDGEYLLYFNGETGEEYQRMSYPLKRLENGESNINSAWGDGTGHRCSKHFFGAPYFDGKKPSIFLARGIYTRHKMIAYDVDPSTHTLKERWRWFNNTNGPWKGQGYHNYCVADVDWDGRDEIVFGSMVIDDNGKGLSTTGFGHGDAEHVGDLNPYVHGHEVFACMEDNAGTNYRDATTSKVYYRYIAGGDVGRCMAGNFSNSYPGSLGTPTDKGPISLVRADAVSGLGEAGVNQNFRIYWDGDLCEETFNYVNGKNTEGCVAKYGSWSPIYTCAGSQTNNDTKGTPCYQGDILGDWREEIIMRTPSNNIRIYSTPSTTKWRIPTLWADHQYRNAMVWQMCGYNQPPRPSYFLGELEGITVAPPPLTNNGRVLVADGSSVSSSYNGKHVLVFDNQNTSVTIENDAKPSVLTFNVPTWVQGTAASESTNANAAINYATYTCTVTGGGLAGDARLVKQGDGILTLPNVAFSHTGNTDIWAGTLNFDGTMLKSDLWLNRFAELNSKGGKFKSIKADYASVIRPGGADSKGNITTDSLALGFGSRVVVDLYASDLSADQIIAKTISIERKTGNAWTTAGPEYLMPVIEVVGHYASGQTTMEAGKYVIATFEGELKGSADNLIIEGLPLEKKLIYAEDGKLIVEILPQRKPASVVWAPTDNSIWNLNDFANFVISGEAEATPFVSGDNILFNDDAAKYSVSVDGSVSPATFTVNSTTAYTFGGSGSIEGNAQFIKEGTGTVTMNGSNSYTGGNHLRGGITKVTNLSNQYSEVGNLGGITTSADKFTMENGAVLQTTAAIETGSPMKMVGEEGGVINNSGNFRCGAALSGTVLTKKGTGALFVTSGSSLKRLVLQAGSVAQTSNAASTIELQGGTLWDDAQCTSHAIYVPQGKTATWGLTYSYYTAYANKITGEGTLIIMPRNTVSRVRITGDWSEFEGTIKHTNKDIWLPLDMSGGMPNGTLSIDADCGVCNTAKTFTVGQLIGSGSLVQAGPTFRDQGSVSGNNVWNVGNSDGKNFAFAGTFTDNGGSNKVVFNKIGTCKMTVSGKSNHSGATAVNGGELFFKSGATLGVGALSVAKGATLSGITGTTPLTNSSYTFNAGGTLQVGASAAATSGNIDFGGKNVTFAKGSFLQIGVARGASGTATGATNLQNIGTLTMNGTIQLHYASSLNLHVGDSVILWRNVNKVIGTPVLEQSSYYIAEGLFWDDKDLAQGILRVTDIAPVGIRGLDSDADVSVQVISTAGVVVEEFDAVRSNVERIFRTKSLPRGFYILRMKAGKDEETIKLRK